ncbi:MAG TPA: GDP-mannose 4,6-dehydratase, partial [bacterium]|nr:GDP-mannose 4,6-dehydratase [bacterium]
PAEVDLLIGDASKARQILHWQPKTTFRELVELMVEADISLLEQTHKINIRKK